MALDLREAANEMRRLSKLLDDGLGALRRYADEVAQKEHDYRKAKAAAWVSTPRTEDGKLVPAKEREAIVDGATAPERRARDMADNMRQAALEAVRSRRTQVSAWQSLMAAEREEAGLLRYGQDPDEPG